MRLIDSNGLDFSKYQAELFKASLLAVKCSSPIFLRRFMFSGFAKGLDDENFILMNIDPVYAVKEIDVQYGISSYGKIKYSEDEMYWLGYLYRYWAYTWQCSSRSLYKKVKPDELRKFYYPYHSLDPSQAIERVCEAKSLGNDDLVTRGVSILKRLKGFA